MLAVGDGESVHALEPVPLAASIELRAAAGEYAGALELCSYLPAAQGAEREALEGSLRVRHGFHLVAAGDVAGGLGQFARTPRGPVCALQLVPGLVPDLAAAVEALPQAQELAALQRPEPGTPEFLELATELVYFLLETRLVTRALVKAGPEASAAAPGASPSGRSSDGPAGALGVERVGEHGVLEAVDTYILVGLLRIAAWDRLAGFLSEPHSALLAEAGAALEQAGRYHELQLLYRGAGRHRAALDLLRTLAQAPASLPAAPQGRAAEEAGEARGAEAAAAYLAGLGPGQKELVLEYSAWVLAAAPAVGLTIFTGAGCPLGEEEVLAHLERHAPEQRVAYLEARIAQDGTGRAAARYDNALAQLYLERLAPPAGPEAEEAEGRRSALRAKLQRLLVASPHVVPEGILTSLPAGAGLAEERALALGRLRRHAQALGLYVAELKRLDLALGFCARVYGQSLRYEPGDPARCGDAALREEYGLHPEYLAADRDVYRTLVQVLLAGDDDDQEEEVTAAAAAEGGEEEGAEGAEGGAGWRRRAAVEVLGQHYRKMDLARTLDLLPADLPVAQLAGLLEGALQKSSRERRSWGMVRSLARQEERQAQQAALQARRRHVRVTERTTCAICLKRLGNAVFVLQPDDDLAHFVCYRASKRR